MVKNYLDINLYDFIECFQYLSCAILSFKPSESNVFLPLILMMIAG